MQVLSLNFSHKTILCMPFSLHGIQAGSRTKAWKLSGIRELSKSNKVSIFCLSQSSLATENEPDSLRIEDGGEQESFSSSVSQLIPNSDEVKYLLTEICDTTSITEFELKLDGFHLHIKRALSGGIEPLHLPPSSSVSASTSSVTASDAPSSNGPVSVSSLAISKVGPLEGATGTLQERAADEGLAIIPSPKVGFFRRSRTIKGKRAPPSCKEKQVVKEGQVICYIEQLGGEIPVESDVSGEVVRILCRDGEAVGYGDALIAILPSFPGIMMLPS